MAREPVVHPWEFILTEAAVSTLISIKPERDRAFDICKVRPNNRARSSELISIKSSELQTCWIRRRGIVVPHCVTEGEMRW
jgi:hypothetical protein